MIIYQKEYYNSNKSKIKKYLENKSKELGFVDRAQRQRYNRWCKKNNIKTSIKNDEYLDKIWYWINNIDKNN